MSYTSCLKNCVNTHTDQLSVTVFLCGPSSGLAVKGNLIKAQAREANIKTVQGTAITYGFSSIDSCGELKVIQVLKY